MLPKLNKLLSGNFYALWCYNFDPRGETFKDPPGAGLPLLLLNGTANESLSLFLMDFVLVFLFKVLAASLEWVSL